VPERRCRGQDYQLAGGLSAAAQAADFYHGTKLEYAMDMVAKNGIELRRPVNGSELGLGFYVTQRENSASQYGGRLLCQHDSK
jgi:hypothetical protein